MKSKTFFFKSAGRTSLVATFALACAALPSVWAADITQLTANAANTSGFNSGTGWPGGIAPVAGNNYFTSLLLRTPQAAGAFSFAGDSLTLNSSSALFIKSSSGTSATNIITVNNLILNGGTVAVGFGVNDTVSVTLAGTIAVTANSSLSAQGNASNNSNNFEVLAITAPISGAAGTTITVAGGTANTGVLRFSAANTYSGTVTVASPNNGLVASAVNRLLQLDNLNAVQNATLNLTSVANGLSFAAAANTGAFNVGALSGTSNQVLADTASASVMLNVGRNNASTAYSGILSGIGSLTKSGTGTLNLAGASTYTGATNVIAGSLFVNGSLGDTTVSVTGGTLGGTGSIAGSVMVGNATFAPGASPGSLEIAGTLTLGSGTTTAIELGGTAFTLNGTEEYDRTKLTGSTPTLTLAGALAVSLFNGFTLEDNQAFGIFQLGSDATLSGVFAGLGENALVGTFGGKDLYITYEGDFGDSGPVATFGGNDVVLYSIPEPSAAAIGAIGALMLLRRRQR